MNGEAHEAMYQYEKPTAMDRQLDVLQCHSGGGILLGASSLTGQYWLGSLWFYNDANLAPDVDSCTAGVQLEAGVAAAKWVNDTNVFVGLDTGGVAVWHLEDDFRTFVLSQSAIGHDGVVTSVSVNCNSIQAVTAAHDRCIHIWDLPTLSSEYSYKAHSDIVKCVDYHPSDPELFLSCALDNRILLWDRRKPKPARMLGKGPLRNTPTYLRWHPSNQFKFAVGSESGELVMLDTRADVENLLSSAPHSRSVTGLCFCSEKPSLLASVSEDSQTVVTSVDEADGMKILYTDTTHTDFVHGVSWPTSSNLYTCGWDARVLRHNPLNTPTPSVLGQKSLSQETSVKDSKMNGSVLTNGDDSLKHIGDGDAGKTYSGVVKTQQEVPVEGS